MEKVAKLIVFENTSEMKWFLEYMKENSISFSGWARKILIKAMAQIAESQKQNA